MNYPQSPFLRNPLVESQILKRNSYLLKEIIPWLCQTPKITTYRVNLLKIQRKHFKDKLYERLSVKYPKVPNIQESLTIPELICIDPITEPVDLPIETIDSKEIIIDTSCAAAVLRGAHIFAPGVLAMESGTRKGELVKIFADLSKTCRKGSNKRFESKEKLFIGIGKVLMQRYEIYNTDMNVSGIAIEMLWSISNVPSIGNLGFDNEEALLQNLPSIITVRVLCPQPNERILDMCSSPGNKTTHLVEMIHDQGTIVALDKTEIKIKPVKEKILQNNYKSVSAFAFDSTKSYDEQKTENDSMEPPFAANTFDRILLDAPCSALGNRPLLRNDINIKTLESYPCVQKKLFANAVQLLKVNGVLVYSTCTISEDENEGIVAWALQKFPQLELVESEPKVGGSGLPNLGLDDNQRKLVQRFGPRHMNTEQDVDTVGFFIAKFIKRI